ncbi:TPA: phage major capsid protein [Acinetobacter baumannii]|uniref:phage major capsid protein n=1 Tax=Acinetobacter baumannii TaxID=470 RepID=UPI000DE5F15D|nr:phage major capsid protein [Acinetobacter baumannii]SSQ59729.1 bacteriophage protein; major head protein/prohead protease [Acinetobacter baumannii]SSR34123.1 bacteriophage protein; major head protein/prohead protease [Acinetobacter baumannii]HAV2998804.1 phage major capsid protein [Acinetobacter baumannii]HAV3002679.1 phage major capsid protein [Acinetobacter baumannii]HAV3063009.1 phage major capsid protein [Acinetobacter baumannii]
MNKYLKQLLDALAQKNAEKQGIVTKALDAGQTPNEEQEKQIEGIDAEIATLEKNIARVKEMIAQGEKAATTATPVAGQNPQEAQNAANGNPNPTEQIVVKSNLPKGMPFAQFARAKMLACHEQKKGTLLTVVDAAKQLGYGEDVVQYVEKATLGTTTDAGFAAPLVHRDTYTGDFIELLRNATIFDKLKGYRSVPFNIEISGQLSGGSAQWVGEGERKPLTNPTFGNVEVDEHKLAAITVYTQELLRRADPAIDRLVLDDLIEASKALIDTTFLGTQAETSTTPIGVLNGVTAITPSGTTAAQIEADLMKLITAFVTANLSTDNSYFLMSETRAMQYALLRDALGNTYFNGMNFNGTRSLLGIPVVTSQAVGDKVILVKMSELLVAEDGGVDVAYSDQATLVDGSTTHNLWQENKFAIRVEKFITWAKRRAIAAAYIDYTVTP